MNNKEIYEWIGILVFYQNRAKYNGLHPRTSVMRTIKEKGVNVNNYWKDRFHFRLDWLQLIDERL